jgi:hypothetical protein
LINPNIQQSLITRDNELSAPGNGRCDKFIIIRVFANTSNWLGVYSFRNAGRSFEEPV